LRLFSFGGYGLALAALALVVFGAYDSYPSEPFLGTKLLISVHVGTRNEGEFLTDLVTDSKLWSSKQILCFTIFYSLLDF